MRRNILVLGIAALISLFSLPSVAQNTSWPSPNKPITFINPFPPGGAVDAFGRPLAKQLSVQLNDSIVVDNRGGAGGTVGAAAAAKMPPDGYTWLLGAVHHSIAPSMYTNLSYDITKDFEPIAIIGSVPHVIVVNPNKFSKNDLKSIMEEIRKNPGKFNYASTGNGTSQHLTGELFKIQNKLFITHIPYRGTGPALQDLVAGQVDMMFDTLAGAAPFIKSGQLIAVAVASNQRSPAFPNVPTAQELGIKDFVVSSWYAMWAIKGTPKDIVDKMSAEVQIALASPEIKERWAGMGATVPKMSRAELTNYINQEVVRWSEVVKKSGAKLD
ncbi:MAG: tripartite tricarboxylate transporter substrate binding protein [Polynucleobacter sp.]|jgi:tripartite-type tricarboxylate transporter receptor subunit TctC|uniref:Bug family tripartite tricarboxylate transporter substrate binding protein n=1 Tax=Polynucleobacter sp. TaxID=2029855 RepID=UPI00216E7DE0|nr:tripartite tricarboxylate transporter substrate binding protein [Polynucleobacter sp.]MBU3669515.1 tripartite tricarboxylate transporter substrate binding protein [Polynucleobacter sp.]